MCDSYVCAGYIYVLYLEALTSSKNEPDPANYKLFTVSTMYCSYASISCFLCMAIYDIIIANIATYSYSYSIQRLAIAMAIAAAKAITIYGYSCIAAPIYSYSCRRCYILLLGAACYSYIL